VGQRGNDGDGNLGVRAEPLGDADGLLEIFSHVECKHV
jgi:hypothetical protein